MTLFCSVQPHDPQPRNRPPRHIIAAANLRKRFLAVVAALDRLFLLVRREFRRPSHFHAVRLGAFAAFGRAGAYQVALEFGKPTQNREHQAPVRGGGVRESGAARPVNQFQAGLSGRSYSENKF